MSLSTSLSTQLNCASTNSGGSSGGMSAVIVPGASHVSAYDQQSWQSFVQVAELRPAATQRSAKSVLMRFDSPHNTLPVPWTLTQWREDFGWHRSLSDSGRSAEVKRNAGVGATSIETPSAATKTILQSASPTSPAVAQANLKHMLAEVAHDIRSPIAVAQQIISKLAQQSQHPGQWTAEQTELLYEANLRLTQANRWAEGILVQHSLEHGQPVNVRRRFYPQQWLQGVQPLLNSLAKQRGVRLLWLGWDRSLPRLYSDVNQLSRVLLNLVDNAIQASRPGGEVRVQVAWQTRVTQRMVINVEDDGSGLPVELAQQLNVAHASSSSPQQTYSGIGLGLTTAKTLAHALGGTLRVQQPSRGGTHFSLMLPVDNYHSLVHSWIQQSGSQPRQIAAVPQQRVAIHALRSSKSVVAPAMWNEIDLQLQQAASSDDLVYRVARDRWLWLSKRALPSNAAVPPALIAALRKLRDCDNAWNLPLDCRQQQVFVWEPQDAGTPGHHSRSVAAAQPCLMRLTSIIAERIAELIGDHVPPIDDLQVTENPIVIRPAAGGPTRLIRSDRAHWNFPLRPQTPTSPKFAPAVNASLTETPCESFSGTLAELAQQWHSRQVRLDQIQASLQSPRL